MKENMKSLHDIKNNLSEIEFELESFIKVLEMLSLYYDINNQNESFAINKVCIRFLNTLYDDLSDEIEKLDRFY